jgi:RimJ/RimL family protein N-acetyltransferase
MRDIVEIQTERLTLRRLLVSDAARFSELVANPAVVRMTAGIPALYPPVAVEGWILIQRARAPFGRHNVFAIELQGEGLIGCIGAHATPLGFEIGYWLGEPYWGRGLATEAVRGFVAEASRYGGLEAGHFIDNPASGRVLEKAGFTYTGETPALYSLGRGARAPSRRMRHDASFARRAARESLCA